MNKSNINVNIIPELLKKYIAIILFALICQQSIIAQNYINLNAPENGTQVHTACKKIVLEPGYHYRGGNQLQMRCNIDLDQVCELGYSNIDYSPSNTGVIDMQNEVGTTEGSFTVTQTGGASYNIPIFISPGTKQMMPQISINYNSQGGNGIMGVGWSLNSSVISSISRTSKNTINDGYISPVALTNGDRFVLDGSPLFPVVATDNGKDGTIYKTEVESYSRITSYGQVSGGPAYFKIETKDGSILEYGNSTSTFIENRLTAPASPAVYWLLNKVTDSNGNFITVTYFEDYITGEFRVDEINYTGNDAAGFDPYNKVKFLYDMRNDVQTNFIYGLKFTKSTVLSGIKIISENNLVRKYEFVYNYDDNSGTRLSEIVEYGKNNEKYNSTKVGWNVGSNASLPDPTNNIAIGSLGPIPTGRDPKETYTGDYNGDGFSDYFFINHKNNWNDNTTWELYLNNGSGFNGVSAITGTLDGVWQVNNDRYYGPRGGQYQSSNMQRITYRANVVDVNGDGKDDIVLYGIVGYIHPMNLPTNFDVYAAMTFNGSGFDCTPIFHPAVSVRALLNASPPVPDPGNGHAELLGDFDGDGATDLFLYYYDLDKWYIYNFRTQHVYEQSASTDWGNNLLSFNTIDFDGDGKDEFMFTYLDPNNGQPDGINNYYYVLGLDNGGGLYTVSHGGYPNTCEGKDRTIFPGDFNGDGRTDLLSYSYCSNDWGIHYSFRNYSGYPLQYARVAAPFNSNTNPQNSDGVTNFYVADFNGDGKSDIAIADQSNTSNRFIRVYISMGNNVFHAMNDIPISWGWNNIDIMDYNGDGRSDIVFRFQNSKTGISFFTSSPNGLNAEVDNYNKVTSITNGLGATIAIDYNTLPLLAHQGKYLKGSSSSFPVIDLQKPLSVVKEFAGPDGVGGKSITTFNYLAAKLHLQGKGFLGFANVVSRNNLSSLVESNLYSIYNLNSKYYIPYLSEKFLTYIGQGGAVSYSLEKMEYDFSPINTNVLEMKLKKQTSTDFISVKLVERINDSYDNYGNVTHQTIKVNTNLLVTEISNTYTSNASAWIPSKLATQDIQVTRRGEVPVNSKTHYEYNNYGQITDEYKNFGSTTNQIHTVFSYNGNNLNVGLPDSKSIIPSRANQRNYAYEYDNNYRTVVKEHNPLGQISEKQFDFGFGVPISNKGIDNLVTSFEYDGFGRETKTTTPDNLVSLVERLWINPGTMNGNDPLNIFSEVLYCAQLKKDGSPTERKYFDFLNRELESEIDGFSGKLFKQKSYDNKGNIEFKTSPFKSGNTTFLTTQNYYQNGHRPNELTTSKTRDGADELSTSYEYFYSTDGSTKVKVIDPSGKETSKTLDATESLSKATDNGGEINYFYNSFNQLKQIDVNGSITQTMTYDDYGFQTSLYDKDANTTFYSYDDLGQLIAQIDANGNNYVLDYDLLGRVYQKTSPEGIYSYSYVPNGNGINQIQQITAPNNTSFSYTYDALQRQLNFIQNVDALSLTTTYAYDNFGNVSTVTDPNGFVTNNEYNNCGYLKLIKHGGLTVWQGDEVNESGRFNKFTLGNGIQTNVNYNSFNFPYEIQASSVQHLQLEFDIYSGNLKNRRDVIKNRYESFLPYDNFNRLTTVVGPAPLSITYNNNGTILNKSDAGAYSDYSSIHSDAVAQVTNIAGSAISHPTQDVIYNSFNKVSTITENGNILNITYNPDQQRVKTELSNSGTNIYTKYFHGCYEKLIVGGHTYEINYVKAPSGLCAMHVTIDGANGKMYYVYSDHLGSMLTLTDDQGTVKYEQSFDAWGRNRNPITWDYSSSSVNVPPVWLYRGYTGHEHLSEFALINMNGRCYDPILGMMLSPDNYVQAPDNTKSYNRYGYAFNNPLVYTDPSGDIIFTLLACIIPGAQVLLPLAIAMDIGGALNVAMHEGQGNIAAAYGIGAIAGAAAFYTGGAALSATGLVGASVAGGAVAGFAGTMVASPILGVGNHVVFNDPYSIDKFTNDLIFGTLGGAIVGGTLALLSGKNIWYGEDIGNGRSPFSWDNSDKWTVNPESPQATQFAANPTVTYDENVVRSKLQHGIRDGRLDPLGVSNEEISNKSLELLAKNKVLLTEGDNQWRGLINNHPVEFRVHVYNNTVQNMNIFYLDGNVRNLGGSFYNFGILKW